jgi:hypothetical protein
MVHAPVCHKAGAESTRPQHAFTTNMIKYRLQQRDKRVLYGAFSIVVGPCQRAIEATYYPSS